MKAWEEFGVSKVFQDENQRSSLVTPAISEELRIGNQMLPYRLREYPKSSEMRAVLLSRNGLDCPESTVMKIPVK